MRITQYQQETTNFCRTPWNGVIYSNTARLLEVVKNMPKLNIEQKDEIVSMLACFRQPNEIVRHFQLVHGIAMDHKQVGRYDPTRSYFAGGERWRSLFQAKREEYLRDAASIPVAHLAYRLTVLQEGVEEAKSMGNWKLVAQLLKQAAKEVGNSPIGSFQGGGNGSSAQGLSHEERRLAFAELVRKAKEHIKDRKLKVAA